MIISLVYVPPFLAVERTRETVMVEFQSPSLVACDEAHSGSVLQRKGS